MKGREGSNLEPGGNAELLDGGDELGGLRDLEHGLRAEDEHGALNLKET